MTFSSYCFEVPGVRGRMGPRTGVDCENTELNARLALRQRADLLVANIAHFEKE